MSKKLNGFLMILLLIATVLSIFFIYWTHYKPPQQYIVVWESLETNHCGVGDPVPEYYARALVKTGNELYGDILHYWMFPYYPDRSFQYGREGEVLVWQNGVLVKVEEHEVPIYIPWENL